MNQDKQTEALRLADELDGDWTTVKHMRDAAAELRRLHARVQELEEQTAHMADLVDQANYAHQKMKEAQARVRELEAKLAALKAAPAKLEDIEQYRLQMAGISTAAFGYWKEGDDIHPDYDTLALRDVAKLYAKYDELYKAAHAAQAQRVPLSDAECDRLISALCPDFSDERFAGDRPIMRQLARDALATQEKQG